MPWLFFERGYLAPKHTKVTINTSCDQSIPHRPFASGCPLSKRFRDIRPKTPVPPWAHTERHTDTHRKWFYILSHAMHCIGQAIICCIMFSLLCYCLSANKVLCTKCAFTRNHNERSERSNELTRQQTRVITVPPGGYRPNESILRCICDISNGDQWSQTSHFSSEQVSCDILT